MIVKRYTPPTCTLEVFAASTSPLSLWWGRPLVKELRFELHFDDPKIPKEERVTIKGDRPQLELLSNTISNYVQDFLQQPPRSLPLLVGAAPNNEQTTIEKKNKSFVSSTATPYLQPKGLVSHQLFFDPLATEATGKPEVQLTAVQLFDLATALEQCSAELPLLPDLLQSSRSKRKVIPLHRAAAATVVLAVGVTAATTFQLLNQSQSEADVQYISSEVSLEPEESAAINTRQQDGNENKLAEIPTAPTPSPTLAPSLLQLKTLPPPTTVVAPATPTSDERKTVSLPSEPDSIEPLEPDPSRTPTTSQSASQLSNVEEKRTTVVIAPQSQLPKPTPTSSLEKSTIERQELTLSHRLSPSSPSLSPSSASSSPSSPSLSRKPSASLSRESSASLSRESSASSSPESSLNNAEELEEEKDNTFAAGNTDIPLEPFPEFADLKEDKTAIRDYPAPPKDYIALEPLPQLEEAREYFQARWRSPEGLNKTLEYRLILNPNGSIKTVIPLGNAAIIYLKQANIPLNDESFVSPLATETNPIIRLVLDPDGTVQTFLE